MVDVSGVIYSLRGIHRILKDATASPDDYQSTINRLSQLESILSDLSRIGISSQDPDLFTISSAIKAQADDLVNFVTKFSEKAQLYDASLGCEAQEGIHHAFVPKIRWATLFSKHELSNFKAAVAERVMSVDLLYKDLTIKLLLNSNKSILSLRQRNEIHHARLNANLDSLHTTTDLFSQSLSGLHLEVFPRLDHLQQRLDEHCQTLTTLRPEHEKSLQMVKAQILEHMDQKPRTVQAQFTVSRRRRGSRKISLRSDHRGRSENPSSQAQQISESLAQSLSIVQKFEDAIGCLQLNSPTSENIQTASLNRQCLNQHRGYFVIGTLSEFLEAVTESLQYVAVYVSHIQSLYGPEDIEKAIASLFRFVARVFPQLLMLFGMLYPGLKTIFRTMQVVARSPSLLCSDSIQFEDVLGNTRRLPWTYFRHWNTFASMLKDQFKGKPGEYEVEKHQYRILRSDRLILNENNWEQEIVPRTKLVMSIQVVASNSDVCPRGCESLLRKLCNFMVVCPSCHTNIDLRVDTVTQSKICYHRKPSLIHRPRRVLEDTNAGWLWRAFTKVEETRPNANISLFRRIHYPSHPRFSGSRDGDPILWSSWEEPQPRSVLMANLEFVIDTHLPDLKLLFSNLEEAAEAVLVVFNDWFQFTWDRQGDVSADVLPNFLFAWASRWENHDERTSSGKPPMPNRSEAEESRSSAGIRNGIDKNGPRRYRTSTSRNDNRCIIYFLNKSYTDENLAH